MMRTAEEIAVDARQCLSAIKARCNPDTIMSVSHDLEDAFYGVPRADLWPLLAGQFAGLVVDMNPEDQVVALTAFMILVGEFVTCDREMQRKRHDG